MKAGLSISCSAAMKPKGERKKGRGDSGPEQLLAKRDGVFEADLLSVTVGSFDALGDVDFAVHDDPS